MAIDPSIALNPYIGCGRDCDGFDEDNPLGVSGSEDPFADCEDYEITNPYTDCDSCVCNVSFEPPISKVAISGTHIAWSPITGGLSYGRFISVYAFSDSRQVSDDGGVTWSEVSNLNSRQFHWITYHEGIWLMCAEHTNLNIIHRSTDNGVNWTEYEHIPEGLISDAQISNITWSDVFNCFIMTTKEQVVGSAYYRRSYSSSDGITWTLHGQFVSYFEYTSKVVDIGSNVYSHCWNYDRMFNWDDRDDSGDIPIWGRDNANASTVVKTISDGSKLYISKYSFDGNTYVKYLLDGEEITDNFICFAYNNILTYLGVVNYRIAHSLDGHTWTTLDDTYHGDQGGYICFGADRYVRVEAGMHMTGVAIIP